ITQLRLGQRLELECQTDRQSGAFWFRQDNSGNLHFIASISSIHGSFFEGNERTSTRFEARKDNSNNCLVVKSFTAQDQGNYFCLMIRPQILYFSQHLPAFLPGNARQLPWLHHNWHHEHQPGTPREPFLFSIPAGNNKKKLNSFCKTVLWVPLAGAVLLLLIALAITIMLCQ
ncbi:CD8A protein, partial [Formicarius rufipectus]|nr:CD8A protein [Formicarius rufipectus]